MHRKFFSFGNLRLSYLDTESPREGGTSAASGTVFIAHANGYAGGCYGYYMRRLSATHRVLALDFAGHGQSQFSLDFRTWDFFRDQILALLRHENLEDVIAMGHSLGGGCVLRAAHAEPERFRRLIALDPVLLSPLRVAYMKIFGNPLAKVSRKRRKRFKNPDLARRAFRRFAWPEEVFEDYLQACFRPAGDEMELSCDPRVETKIFETADFASLLKYRRVKTETHIIIPEKYQVCPPATAHGVIRNNAKSSLTMDAGIRHLFPFEKPEWTFEKIKALV